MQIIIKYILPLIFFSFTHVLEIKEAINSSHEGEIICVKGFLLKSEKGEFVLSSVREIKSCCIGKLENEPLQIFLEGELKESSLHRVITVEGRLVIKDIPTLKEVKIVNLPWFSRFITTN